jgi:hypothetical protein
MPFNQNRNFMQQMAQNNQRFQQFAQQNIQRQQNQFKTTANGWARDAQRRSQQQQRNQVQYQRAAHLQQNARSRQPQPPLAASSSSGRPAAQPQQPWSQQPWSQQPPCRRCRSPLRPGLRTCPCCGTSAARAWGRTLWAAVFIILLVGLLILAIAAVVRASSKPSQGNGQAPVNTASQSYVQPQFAQAAALWSPGVRIPSRSASKETFS